MSALMLLLLLARARYALAALRFMARWRVKTKMFCARHDDTLTMPMLMPRSVWMLVGH